jgi:hypothetical protein
MDSLRTWAARVQAGAYTCLRDVAGVTARDRAATAPQTNNAACRCAAVAILVRAPVVRFHAHVRERPSPRATPRACAGG